MLAKIWYYFSMLGILLISHILLLNSLNSKENLIDKNLKELAIRARFL